MIRVMIADDHHLVRQGIRALIERSANVEVVAEAGDGLEAFELLARAQPDVLVIDIAMPLLTGIQVLERIRQEHIETRVLILSMYSDETLVRQALRSGAKGYLLKDSLKEDLIQAIDAASRDEYYFTPLVSNILIDDFKHKKPEVANPLDALTSREKEVLKLIADGCTNTTIAGTLHISVKTVEKHRSNLLEKLKVQDTATLIKLAIKYHLVFIDKDGS